MGRREFIALLAASVWSLAARAQSKGKLPTVGLLGANALTYAPWVAAFAERLHELGWIEGRNVAIERRWSEGREERAAEIAGVMFTPHDLRRTCRTLMSRLGVEREIAVLNSSTLRSM